MKWLKKKKEEARRAELAAADSDDDCSASSPKCRRPTGKQVRVFDSRLRADISLCVKYLIILVF